MTNDPLKLLSVGLEDLRSNLFTHWLPEYDRIINIGISSNILALARSERPNANAVVYQFSGSDRDCEVIGKLREWKLDLPIILVATGTVQKYGKAIEDFVRRNRCGWVDMTCDDPKEAFEKAHKVAHGEQPVPQSEESVE